MASAFEVRQDVKIIEGARTRLNVDAVDGGNQSKKQFSTFKIHYAWVEIVFSRGVLPTSTEARASTSITLLILSALSPEFALRESPSCRCDAVVHR
jgi:hypothetical protein